MLVEFGPVRFTYRSIRGRHFGRASNTAYRRVHAIRPLQLLTDGSLSDLWVKIVGRILAGLRHHHSSGRAIVKRGTIRIAGCTRLTNATMRIVLMMRRMRSCCCGRRWHCWISSLNWTQTSDWQYRLTPQQSWMPPTVFFSLIWIGGLFEWRIRHSQSAFIREKFFRWDEKERIILVKKGEEGKCGYLSGRPGQRRILFEEAKAVRVLATTTTKLSSLSSS